MSPNQIKSKLVKAGVDITGVDIKKDEIEIILGYEEHSNNGHRYGSCDEDLVSNKWKEIYNVIPELKSGYYTGYGSVIARIGYEPIKGDWNDPSSEHHY